MHWWSRYHNKNFYNQQYNPSYLGKYWCQVINTTADPDQPLMRSNMFTLLAPEYYTQLTCTTELEVQSENNSTCADLPVAVYSEQITLPMLSSSYGNFYKSSCWKMPDCTIVGQLIFMQIFFD